MVKSNHSMIASVKTSSVPDAEKSMQELTSCFSQVQEEKSNREQNVIKNCELSMDEIEQNIICFKTEVKRLKANREFLMAQLSEEKLLQHLEAKKIVMNKALLKKK